MYQSPYKGFNRNKKMEDFMIKQVEGINPPIRGSIAKNCLTIYTPMTDRINPPIRGSIDEQFGNTFVEEGTTTMYQSPYKGFNRIYMEISLRGFNGINPPIRGSIEVYNR